MATMKRGRKVSVKERQAYDLANNLMLAGEIGGWCVAEQNQWEVYITADEMGSAHSSTTRRTMTLAEATTMLEDYGPVTLPEIAREEIPSAYGPNLERRPAHYPPLVSSTVTSSPPARKAAAKSLASASVEELLAELLKREPTAHDRLRHLIPA